MLVSGRVNLMSVYNRHINLAVNGVFWTYLGESLWGNLCLNTRVLQMAWYQGIRLFYTRFFPDSVAPFAGPFGDWVGAWRLEVLYIEMKQWSKGLWLVGLYRGWATTQLYSGIMIYNKLWHKDPGTLTNQYFNGMSLTGGFWSLLTCDANGGTKRVNFVKKKCGKKCGSKRRTWELWWWRDVWIFSIN